MKVTPFALLLFTLATSASAGVTVDQSLQGEDPFVAHPLPSCQELKISIVTVERLEHHTGGSALAELGKAERVLREIYAGVCPQK